MTPLVENIMRIDDEIKIALNFDLPDELKNPPEVKGGEEE